MYEGGCFCGAVRYVTNGSASLETNCHCTTCRRTSGAPFVAWFTVATSTFRFTSGSPTRFRSSDHVQRTFCSRCGTPLTFESTLSPGEIDITTCSLDDPGRVPPRDHTWTRAQLPWITLADDLPRYAKRREP